MIPLREQELLREKFSRELASRVRIDFFTQKETSLFVPGRQPCPYCKPTRQMLEELAALTDKISLRQHIFEEAREAVAQYKVERIPAIVLHGGDKRWLKYYGFPSGHEFATLIETIVDISGGITYVSDTARKRLRKLKKDVRIQVFVTPACPHCPQMARLAYHLALESPHITAEVIEATEFPELTQRYQVRAVPTTIIDDKLTLPGSVPESVLLDIIERVAQPAPLTEATAAPETGPVTPMSQPSATAGGGKLILP
ncbi:MAG: protein disulfide oxidoreductase [Dehalococcoidia bacterium]